MLKAPETVHGFPGSEGWSPVKHSHTHDVHKEVSQRQNPHDRVFDDFVDDELPELFLLCLIMFVRHLSCPQAQEAPPT